MKGYFQTADLIRTFDEQFNNSNITESELLDILSHNQMDRNVSETTESVVIVIYSVFIIVGLILNILVTFVVVCRRKMHTARNLYIVNLTAWDISLCIICMPFTLVRILRSSWPLGLFLCKLEGALQCINVMMAVGTITVIALDRYFAICYRPREHNISTRRRVILSIILLWIISLFASIPLFINISLIPVEVFTNITLYEVCLEQWSTSTHQIIYGVSMLLVLTIIPPGVVATVYTLIARHLQKNLCWQRNSSRAAREIQRNRRMTFLLSGIVIILAISWLPLTSFTLLNDLGLFKQSKQTVYTIFAVVHTLAMSTALTNPIVYGWLNSNIRSELMQMFPSMSQHNNNFLKCCEDNSRNIDEYRNNLGENETMTTHVEGSSLKTEAITLLTKEPIDENSSTTL